MRPLVVIAGFAQLGAVLATLANGVTAAASRSTTSVYELLRDEAAQVPDKTVWRAGEPSVYAHSLAKVLKVNGRSTVLGWSMGGMVALEVAHFFPELVDSLVLCASSACFVAKLDEGYAGLPGEQLRAFRLGVQSAPDQTFRGFFSAVYQGEGISEQVFDAKVQAAMAMDRGAIIHSLLYLEQADLRSLLPKIEARILLLHGSEDTIIPPIASEYLAAALGANAKMILLDGGSHGIFEVDLENTLTKINLFVTND